MFSKSSAYLCVAVMAAISVGVGCADGSRKVTQRKSLAGNKPANQKDMITQDKMDPATGQVMKDKSGKVIKETVPRSQARDPLVRNANPNTPASPDGDPNFTPTGAETKDPSGKTVLKNLNVPESDKTLATIESQEKDLTSGNVVTRDELPAGKYTLKSVQTSALIDGNRVNEKTRAIQNTNLNSTGSGRGGFRLDNSNDKNSAGFLSLTFDDKSRSVDIPVSFIKPAGKWTPERSQAANMSFVNAVTIDANGKALLNDSIDNSNPGNQIAIFTILASGTLQQDKSYRVQDGGSVIYLRMLQKSESQVVAYMAFEEQRQAKGAKVNFDRAIFFTFDVAPDNSKTAEAKDDDIFTIKSRTSGEALN